LKTGVANVHPDTSGWILKLNPFRILILISFDSDVYDFIDFGLKYLLEEKWF